MSTQPLTSFESLREPTGQERTREATVRFAVFNLERVLHDVEEAAIAYVKAQEVPAKPELEMPQATMASMVVETTANDEAAARSEVDKAFDEVFKNGN